MDFDRSIRSRFPLFVDYNGYPTTNMFYIGLISNPHRDIGSKMVKIWASRTSFSNGLFIFSQELPSTKKF